MNKRLFLLIILCIFIPSVSALEKVNLYKCVDGDTFRIKVNGEDTKVRMLAIDTPESVKEKELEYYGYEASEYTCNKLKNAKKIELEYDNNSGKTDKYGRILAWVFVDGNLLQEELVKNGYAKVAYLYADYKYTSKLQEVQEKASMNSLGIWDNDKAQRFNPSSREEDNSEEEIKNIEIIILTIIFLIMTFFSSIKLKKKK